MKLGFHATKVTSDAVLMACLKLKEAVGLIPVIDSELRDNRMKKSTRYSIAELLKQSKYSQLAGYEDTDGAERLALDPAMRQVTESIINAYFSDINIWIFIVRNLRFWHKLEEHKGKSS